jgi:hypothetical protein
MGLDTKTDWLTDRQSQCDFDLPGLLIALMVEAARTSETLVNFYQTTRCYNPEDSNLNNDIALHSVVKLTCSFYVLSYTGS